jgi:ATP-binding cassette subfamily C protein LapB
MVSATMAEAAPSRRWLRDLLTPLSGTFLEVAAFSFAINLLALAVPVFVLQVYDRVVAYAGMSTLQGLLVGMAIVLGFDFVLRQARGRILQTVALRLDVAVARRLFQTLTGLPLQTLERTRAERWACAFRDVDTVRNALSGSTALLVCELPFLMLSFALILVIAAPVAGVLVAVVPLMAVIAWRSNGAMTAAGRSERAVGQSRDALLGEIIVARGALKAHGAGAALEARWEKAHAEAILAAAVRGGRSDTYANLATTLTLATTVAMTAVGALAILDQTLTIGALVAANMLSGRLLGPLHQLVAGWRGFIAARMAIGRLGAIFALGDGARAHRRNVAMARPVGAIALDELGFAFATGAAPVLAGVSLRLPPRGLHALIGANGSGKTTLLKLIRGLYRPVEGRILIDDADIAQFADDELGRWIGYLPQDDALFAGTIRDNIALAHPDAGDAEILAAARLAILADEVATMAEGYATEVGEGGRRLSAGQRQRVGLARALLEEPAIVLLDEPSSHLDEETTVRLRESLRALARTRPVVVATHSRLLLAAADSVTRLAGGTIASSSSAGEAAASPPSPPSPPRRQRPPAVAQQSGPDESGRGSAAVPGAGE